MDTPVARFRRSVREMWDVRLRENEGNSVVDVRVWAWDDAGDLVSTRHGVRIKPRELRPLIEALRLAESVAVDRRLIEPEA